MDWLLSFEVLGVDTMDMLRISPVTAVLYGIGSFAMSSHNITKQNIEHSLGWCTVGMVLIVCVFALS